MNTITLETSNNFVLLVFFFLHQPGFQFVHKTRPFLKFGVPHGSVLDLTLFVLYSRPRSPKILYSINDYLITSDIVQHQSISHHLKYCATVTLYLIISDIAHHYSLSHHLRYSTQSLLISSPQILYAIHPYLVTSDIVHHHSLSHHLRYCTPSLLISSPQTLCTTTPYLIT